MTRSIEQNNKYPNTYGGKIFFSDFCTDYPSKYSSPEGGSSIASKIMNDIKFDKQCHKSILDRQRRKQINDRK